MKVGKTEFMLTELLGAVLDGQPYSVVVGLTHRHAAQLCDRAHWMFVDAGLPCKRLFGLALDVDGSRVHFTSRFVKPCRLLDNRAGWFIDHSVTEQTPHEGDRIWAAVQRHSRPHAVRTASTPIDSSEFAARVWGDPRNLCEGA